MRPLKVLAAALALSLLAAPALAEARPAKPPAAAKAKAGAGNAKNKAGHRETKVLEVLKKQGIDDARARRVVAVMKKYRTERQPVREEMKKHRESLRSLVQSNSTDEAAYTKAIDGIDAQRKKLAQIQERQVTEIRGILKPSEQAKVMRLLNNAKKHGAKGKGAKDKSAKKASHGNSAGA